MDEQNELEPEEPQPSSQGATTDLGPRPKSGGEQEPGGLVPPYDGRQTETKDSYDRHTEKVFHGADDVPPGPGRVISDEERDGVPPTDTEAESPLGVGVSMTRRGEDVDKQEDEPGREDTGTKGPSDRPVGVSDERASTAVDPNETESGGPTMPAGDQGG
ncbi:MAG TPA: hypothetical protein VHS79_05385 [Actinomycetes bacterium]|jgi:hypothetical protein|nr:hypothetical protein [Actinomycetes bacterium]